MSLLSTFVSSTILLGPTQYVNLVAGICVLVIGYLLYAHDRKNEVHRLVFLIALFLAFWAMSSTLSDIMHEDIPARTWAQLSILGPFWFSGLFHIFSYKFPPPGKKLQWWKALLILSPSIAIIPFVPTEYNLVSTTLRDWGTDYVPGVLYSYGSLYLLINVICAGINFSSARRHTKDKVVKKQVVLLYFGITSVVVSLILTNAILPIVFGFTEASVFGPASSLFFVIFVGYAIVRHRLLETKIIATELFAFLLIYLSLAQMFRSASAVDAAMSIAMFAATTVFGILLIRSVNLEVRRREELQELSTRLTKTNADLREADKVRTEFLSIASHQLRTPLTVIKGYLSLMREGAYGQLSEAVSPKVGHIFEMNERMIQSISNLLNVTRIEKRHIEYNMTKVDVNLALSQLAEDMTFKAEQAGSKFVFSLPELPLPKVKADADKLREVLSNLVDNAFKYTPKGGTVTLAATNLEAEGKVKFTVSDTGMGISEKDAKRLFQQYYRAGAKKAGIEGTGIGLFICKTFAEGMGGEVWLESSLVGKGSTFAFTLSAVKR